MNDAVVLVQQDASSNLNELTIMCFFLDSRSHQSLRQLKSILRATE